MPRAPVFFSRLADQYGPDINAVARAIDAYRADPTPDRLSDLHLAAESQRQELFRRLNAAPGGTRTLVQMRADLLTTVIDSPDRAVVAADLLHLFRSWFNRGFLVMQRIDWRTSALVLERLIQYEAVHQVQGWDDLRPPRERRRCLRVSSIPHCPTSPLIFIEAALTPGILGYVRPLPIRSHPSRIRAARALARSFYSITNFQQDSGRCSSATFLIKQVCRGLEARVPEDPEVRGRCLPYPASTRGCGLHRDLMWPVSQRADVGRSRRPVAAVPDAHGTNSCSSVRITCCTRSADMRHGRRGTLPSRQRRAPRAAELGRRLSFAGFTSSLGITANYVYRMADVEENHEAYAKDYKVVASFALERLAREVKVPAA
jgi:malonyl-CoA decarboxylase